MLGAVLLSCQAFTRLALLLVVFLAAGLERFSELLLARQLRLRLRFARCAAVFCSGGVARAGEGRALRSAKARRGGFGWIGFARVFFFARPHRGDFRCET